jgi:hypothetical protein
MYHCMCFGCLGLFCSGSPCISDTVKPYCSAEKNILFKLESFSNNRNTPFPYVYVMPCDITSLNGIPLIIMCIPGAWVPFQIANKNNNKNNLFLCPQFYPYKRLGIQHLN